jgi:hypothetical protein
MLKPIFVLFAFLFINSSINAQNDSTNRRELRPLGLSVDALGPTVFYSINFDYFLDHHMSCDVGWSPYGYYAGVKAHFGKKRQAGMPYIGVMYATVYVSKTSGEFPHMYVPIGYHFVGKRGLNASIEIAANFGSNFGNKLNDEFYKFYPQLRLGYRIKRKKVKTRTYTEGSPI